jgi:hypothetical protein
MNRRSTLTIAVPMLAVTLLSGIALAGSGLETKASAVRQCQQLMPGQGSDCVCVADFLESRLPGPAVEIVMLTWGFSVDRRLDHAGDVQSLYMKYGTLQIDQVMRDFHRVRVDLFTRCPNADADEDGLPLQSGTASIAGP